MKKTLSKLSFIFLIIIFFAGSGFAKTINLKISHFMPTKHVQHKVLADWAKEMETVTNGQLKFKVFPGGQLGKPPHQYENAVKGLTDIAFGLHSYTAGRFPLTSVMRLPFLIKDAETGSLVLWKLYEKYLMKEHSDTKVLWVFVHSPGQIFTTKKPVKTLADLNGLKMRSPGKIMADVLKGMGASAIGMPITQVYTGLERGLLDGVIVPYETMKPFRFYEKTKYATHLDMYTMTFFVTMNKKRYESLPPDLKKAIDEHSGEKMSLKAAAAYQSSDLEGRQLALSKGVIEYKLPAAEKENWKKTASVIVDQWIKTTTEKGLPAQEVFDFVKTSLKEAEQK